MRMYLLDQYCVWGPSLALAFAHHGDGQVAGNHRCGGQNQDSSTFSG